MAEFDSRKPPESDGDENAEHLKVNAADALRAAFAGKIEVIEKFQREEAARVKAMIDRDRADRIRDADRKRAEIELANGSFVNIADSVVEPTPEWLAKGDVATYRPKQPDGTVREVKTVRRETVARVLKMYRMGRVTDEQLAACLWYRSQYDQAGLHGRVKSSHISLTGNTGGGGGGMGQAPMALHHHEAEARKMYRAAKESLTAFYVRFFEAVVINDVPLSRASRFARCRAEKAPLRFRQCCEEVIDFMNKCGIDMTGRDGGDRRHD